LKRFLSVFLCLVTTVSAQEPFDDTTVFADDFLLSDSLVVVVDPILLGAITSLEAGETATAAAELEDIIVQSPGHTQALRLLATCYLRLDDYENAIASCVELAGLDTLDTSAQIGLGYLYQKMGDPDNAELYYSLALERNPNAYHALFGIGWLHLERRNLEGAHDAATRITEIAPEYAANYILLGRVLTVKGFYKEAARAYRRSFDLEPKLRDRYGILLQELSIRHRLGR
jgi:tetratricopeptide (TPR) repeat protein